MRKQLLLFAIRWCATSFGIWLAVRLLGGIEPGMQPTIWTYIGAGLAFSVVNSFLKPIVTILSLPAVVLTLGLFMLVVNGLMVWIALLLVPSLNMSFWQAILAGIVLSIINYVVSELLDIHQTKSLRPNA
ncbi:MAG: phage holin family protein [Candidatus Saccharibacteria bacterium]|nr:phage holin family protein [Candidatus Saccharibacteria bacterium]